MATLVFSTVGTLLGGPIGGAIGALVGQSIDQELLAPKGPRLNELNVQTSSYGTQIPRVYGRMRVAGSVIWATEPVESEEMAGAKGQTGAVTSYAVSLAVAISSRPIAGLGRIWADGKLLRGADGVFKVSTGFRFLDGSEQQEIDPLIASIEGIDLCPAYRGLALAVFENLELAEFGNRIPFLTFEVLGESEAASVPVAAILADASGGSIDVPESETVVGYAAYGANVRAAVAPLVDTFAIPLFDDGAVLRTSNDAVPALLPLDALGSSADEERHGTVQRELAPLQSLPSSLRLGHYDEARDFQSGEARAQAGETGGVEMREECPAVIEPGEAKRLANDILARRWIERDRLVVRLPQRFLRLQPGDLIRLPLDPAQWVVTRVTIESFVVIAELRPAWTPSVITVASDSGRALVASDQAVEPITVATFSVSDPAAAAESPPSLILAASTPGRGWKRRMVSIAAAGTSLAVALPDRKSVLGTAGAALGAGPVDALDEINSIEIVLIDRGQWLESRDEAALDEGANSAMIGNELIQFADVEALGEGRFRLSRLRRGRGGSEATVNRHSDGEAFVLLEPATLRKIEVPPWLSAAGCSVLDSPESVPPIVRHPYQAVG